MGKQRRAGLPGSQRDENIKRLQEFVEREETQAYVKAQLIRMNERRDFAHMQLSDRLNTVKFHFTPPLTHEQLAHMVGVSTKTEMSRILNRTYALSDSRFRLMHETLKKIEEFNGIITPDQLLPWEK